MYSASNNVVVNLSIVKQIFFIMSSRLIKNSLHGISTYQLYALEIGVKLHITKNTIKLIQQ